LCTGLYAVGFNQYISVLRKRRRIGRVGRKEKTEEDKVLLPLQRHSAVVQEGELETVLVAHSHHPALAFGLY